MNKSNIERIMYNLNHLKETNNTHHIQSTSFIYRYTLNYESTNELEVIKFNSIKLSIVMPLIKKSKIYLTGKLIK